jgi:hypothetical protein
MSNVAAQTRPEEAADRTTRHLRMCAELADLGMQLARAAAVRALAGASEPEVPPTDSRPPSPTEPAPATAPRAATTYFRAPTLKAPTCKPIDPALLFTRLAACVRASIALEARLTAGTPRTASLALRADPRRAPLQDAFHRITASHPERATLRREATTRLDEQLAADSNQAIDLPTLLFGICDDLAIEIDFATLPDKILNLIPDEPPGDDDDDAPDPRATSPP